MMIAILGVATVIAAVVALLVFSSSFVGLRSSWECTIESMSGPVGPEDRLLDVRLCDLGLAD
ncbi:MAG: hypothetical protein R3C68_02565 [Myxococcota bacterium]